MRRPPRAEERGGEVVCSRCGRPMKAELGASLDSAFAWLWWRCERGHISEAVPLPAALRIP